MHCVQCTLEKQCTAHHVIIVDSQRLITQSQNRTKCVKYVWLRYPTWPSRWVLCISMQWLRLKGCHVACDEWTSGEICSLQHMWVIGSVMWVAASGESLNFGVQGASATNWFPRVNGARDKGIWLYIHVYVIIFHWFSIQVTLEHLGQAKILICQFYWPSDPEANNSQL